MNERISSISGPEINPGDTWTEPGRTGSGTWYQTGNRFQKRKREDRVLPGIAEENLLMKFWPGKTEQTGAYKDGTNGPGRAASL